MQLLILSASINAIAAFLIGLVSYLRNPKNITYKTFSLMNIAVTLWSISYTAWLLSTSNSQALFWTRSLALFSTLIPIFYLHWILVFLKIKKTGILVYGYTLTLIYILLSFTPYYVINVEPTLFFSYWPKGSYIYLSFIILGYILLIGAGLLSIIKYYPKVIPSKREQLKYIMLGSIVGFGGGLTNFPLWFNINIPPYGNILVVFYVLLLGYAMLKHRLMDIRALVVKSVTYSVMVGLVAATYIGIIYYAKQSYSKFIDPNVLFVVAGFVLVFGFQPLRRGLQKATNRVFFKDRYKFKELVGQVSNMLSTKLTLDDISEGTLNMLTNEIKINKGAIILTNNDKISDIKTLEYSKSRNIWTKPTGIALDKDKTIIADELAEGSEEQKNLRKSKIEIMVPLINEGETVGVLAFGEKSSGDMFTTEDLKVLDILAPQIAIALQNAVLFQDKERRIKELDALNKLALHVGSTLHLDKILDAMLEEAIDVTEAECGSIMLLDKDTKALSIKTAKGISKGLINKNVKIGEGISGWVAENKKPLNIDGQNKKFKPFIKREELTSSLSVPLKMRDELIGVLNVNRRKNKTPFTDQNMYLMMSFAAQAAEAIENANLYENLEKTFLETITALAAAVDAKDHYTYGHAEAVTVYTKAIAKEMRLPREEISKFEVAAKLHDIGKIGVDERILNKPGKLSEKERKVIEEHPKTGVNILKSVESLKEVIPLILYHHERLDGLGYPTGMPGHIIPLGAKILAVADTFDAMTSDRPYRKALSSKTAVAELKRCSGTQFDPSVVEAFVSLHKSGKIKKYRKTRGGRRLRAIRNK